MLEVEGGNIGRKRRLEVGIWKWKKHPTSYYFPLVQVNVLPGIKFLCAFLSGSNC